MGEHTVADERMLVGVALLAASEWMFLLEIFFVPPCLFFDDQIGTQVIPILRAGLALAEHAPSVLPATKTYHLVVASEYLEARQLVSIELSINHAGGTIVAAIELLKDRGVDSKQIKVISAVASPPALQKLSKKFSGLRVYAGIIDPVLNEKGFGSVLLKHILMVLNLNLGFRSELRWVLLLSLELMGDWLWEDLELFVNSFADLQKPQLELDGKACAAAGQSGLMALYDALFSQLDVQSSQLLVTDSEFKHPDFRMQLIQTVNSLLALRVIPVFNENDAISTRKAPYEDSFGIFWDNDSLAALLALELKADLLVLLSDVEGLYSAPPGEPHSKIIHTYIKERHQCEITFGDKSRVGRGGMTAKVKSAVYAASAGTPVVIISGFATDSIIKVLQGERIGTLFHQDAHLWALPKEVGAREMAVSARECSRRLQSISSEDRSKILLDIADALEAHEKLIRTENEADIAAAQEAGYENSLISRHGRPNRPCLEEDRDGLVLEKTSCPLGVLLIVFESRPDALVQIASLAVRSGNGLLLKGGKEAMRSNAILHKVITGAIPDTVGEKLIGLVRSRDEIPDLLKLDDVIDLVIPRGSNKLVTQIKGSTKIPVLGHADGICHVYVDKSADMDMAKRIVLDAKIDYPAACNAMETLLIHKDLLKTKGLNDLMVQLRGQGVTIFGGSRASIELDIPRAHSFHHEYNSMACTIEIVDDVHAAIDHIHRHGSAHTDCIVAKDLDVAEIFLHQVDRILRGSGQVVDGDKGVIYTHKNLPL
ncbi:putative Delta-1-pyrroline-5-carboxylate synthase 1 [Cocos nucifera]|uniref:Putative Delta-1-pyrroline-5-carboxylate synthase 1 n=1 Tax=Cocos nucifera TaxID=13894 RepID=A0A8K0NAZ5_COCNU|nr:putative Delta-1-pyrroline-5-carboxylate synthase 1 [Cocos nucifera]